MWYIVSPSTFISLRIPLGVALSGPPSEWTEVTKRLCSSGVHRRRDLEFPPPPSPPAEPRTASDPASHELW